MRHFLIIAYRHEFCGWVAMLPDFVGVTGRGSEMGLAMWRATKAAREVYDVLAQLDQPLPTPTDLAAAQRKHEWVSAYDLDWSTAVVRSARLSDTSQTAARSRAAHQAPKLAIIPLKRGSAENSQVMSRHDRRSVQVNHSWTKEAGGYVWKISPAGSNRGDLERLRRARWRNERSTPLGPGMCRIEHTASRGLSSMSIEIDRRAPWSD